MSALAGYKESLANITVNKKGGDIAPHKAILLLAVIDLIENGIITDRFIPLSDSLIRTFDHLWGKYVPVSSPFSRKFSYPFFHLQSSPFWKLIKTDNYVGQKEYSSIPALKRDFAGAEIDGELFQLLLDKDCRDELRLLLYNCYLRNAPSAVAGKLGLMILLGIICSVA